MLAHPGEDAHFDLAPSDLPPRRAGIGSKRDHHPIGAHDQGGGGKIGRQRLRLRQVALR
jgi:hypothetical protein